MKAYAIVKFKEHPQPNSAGAQKGDIIDILPIYDGNVTIGTKDLDFFIPIVVDMKIPCGDGNKEAAGTFTFNSRGPEFRCGECKFNDIDLCERIKHLKAEWGGGDIDHPPTVVRKRMYKIDIETVIPKATLDTAKSVDKTEVAKASIITWSKTNEQPLSIVTLKDSIT